LLVLLPWGGRTKEKMKKPYHTSEDQPSPFIAGEKKREKKKKPPLFGKEVLPLVGEKKKRGETGWAEKEKNTQATGQGDVLLGGGGEREGGPRGARPACTGQSEGRLHLKRLEEWGGI